MACNPEVLENVPLFALLDQDERAVLAAQVELKRFVPRQKIYKKGDPGGQAYVLLAGKVRVTTVDEDQQEVVVDEPGCGEFFGFASMLEQTPHATRNPNELIETEATLAERVADHVARFGGSWTFIISCGVMMIVYTTINSALRGNAWDPYA
jgi:CRP/FNR family transcriptional regulator, cyclic AMP receptor protein